ncbi:exosome complex exonuclease Rrp41 [Nitzschia inconspicua]|uniref:Exosome complex exonuclease Rrp41 n=1 Tax=Nitzschia inconspicua TaxID=303405 RepID=A0A9K3L9U2_9STRA|nr:exosome complex exonuclease Rrp41 [Nitzschia inconspicua]
MAGSNSNTNKRTLRPDGRPSQGNTLRPLACELSCTHRADGSALWKAGLTHVLAAVYGPIAPLVIAKENPNLGMVSVVIKMADQGQQQQSNNQTLEYGQFLHDVLTACIDVAKFPRCVMEVVLQVIQSDGSMLACLLHAAVAALMDAGIDLLYMPVATTCLVVLPSSLDGTKKKKSRILLDPTSAEEFEDDDCSSVVVLVNEKNHPGAILGSHTFGGGVPLEDLLACVQVASKACHAIPAFFRLAMEQKVTRESQTLWSR